MKIHNFSYLRHDLIFLKQNSTFTITGKNKIEINEYIREWINKKLPFIYTRQPLNNPLLKLVYLGLTAFINKQKYRVSLIVEEKYIESRECLPLINFQWPIIKKEKDMDVLNHLNWQSYQIHIYGSFFLQYLLPKESLVNENSDLDILLIYKNHSLREIKLIIEVLNQKTKKTVDGEVRFGNDSETVKDISIKELFTNSSTLLVKTTQDIYLLSRETLYAAYPSLCA